MAGRKPSAGTTKPPSPSTGSITTQARLSAPTCFSITSIARAAACSPVISDRLAERVGHRRAVDLTGERSEAVLVGHVLGRHRHRQVGAPVVGVVEDDDRVAAGVGARDLDRVLDRLGAGVEQRRLLRVVARGEPGERLAHLHVALVGRDHEAGVRERRHLLGDPSYDLGRAVADAGDRDAAGQVDQRVAVDVDDDPATGGRDVHREHAAHPRGDRRPAALLELDGPGPGDLGDHAPLLRQLRSAVQTGPRAELSGFSGHATLRRRDQWFRRKGAASIRRGRFHSNGRSGFRIISVNRL